MDLEKVKIRDLQCMNGKYLEKCMDLISTPTHGDGENGTVTSEELMNV